MTVFAFPALPRSKSAFMIIPASSLSRNSFSNVESVSKKAGDLWDVTLNFAFLTHAQARVLRAALVQLKGQVNRITISDTAHSNQGAWDGTPVVDGANQYGSVLNVKGFSTLSGVVAVTGDRFTLNGRLHELTEDAVSNAEGQATLRFQPEILWLTTDAAPLTTTKPYSTFLLKDPSQIPSFSQSARGVHDVTLNFVESLRP